MKLYEITSALLWCADSDELASDMEAQLDALEMERVEKAEAICKILRNLESEETALAAEAERFAKRAQHVANGKERLKNYMKANLAKTGTTSLDAGLFRIRVVKNSVPTVTVDCDPASLPEEYRVVEVKADKKALTAAWKDGLTMPHAVSVERGTHLRIS